MKKYIKGECAVIKVTEAFELITEFEIRPFVRENVRIGPYFLTKSLLSKRWTSLSISTVYHYISICCHYICLLRKARYN